jgi:hypothetical protein
MEGGIHEGFLAMEKIGKSVQKGRFFLFLKSLWRYLLPEDSFCSFCTK